MPHGRNLFLCFDAFGTLFKPKAPIEKQYGDVARSLGLGGFSDEDVKRSFRAAYTHETKRNPIFGRSSGSTAEGWWRDVITNTFQPLIKPGDTLPRGLVPSLLNRFRSGEGYVLFPDVLPLIGGLRDAHRAATTKVVVGVITNSDDRVPDILSSLGVKVNPRRCGRGESHSSAPDTPRETYDIDFTVMSFDAGYEKPDPRIFSSAEDLLKDHLETEKSGGPSAVDEDMSQWRKVYAGDEYDKDIVGARQAGWGAVLIDRETPGERGDVAWLHERPVGSLYEVINNEGAVGFDTLARLADWLPGQT